ncbi:hypothetical protein ACIL5Z_004811, partial [Escherichia coli]|nr:hypothetical protein [Escherichia coli]EKA2438551.1 hypothetical protein [Escherichia coli]
MTLNTSQVSYYMTQRKKGITQHISAMKAGISVRSGRRIEKGEWAKNSVNRPGFPGEYFICELRLPDH